MARGKFARCSVKVAGIGPVALRLSTGSIGLDFLKVVVFDLLRSVSSNVRKVGKGKKKK